MRRSIYKELFFIILVSTLLFSPFAGAFENIETSSDCSNVGAADGKLFNRAYTHTILAEQGTATWCPHCPPVAGYLWSIYSSGTYDFYYVALVDDMNSDAAARNNELGLTGFPTVFFDGGYTRVVGDVGSTGPYINALNNCGSRNVADVDLDLHIEWLGSATIGVIVNITNNEESTYSGHLHAYITEIVSRWNDYDGYPYRFAMLGYAFNQDVTVSAGDTAHLSATWDGSAYGYGDITEDNIMVVVSVFSSSSEYTDETTAASFQEDDTPPDTTMDPLPVYAQKVDMISGEASDKRTLYPPPSGGFSINNVLLSLQDLTNGTYWDGSSWTSSEIWLDAEPADGSWGEISENWVYNTSTVSWVNGHEYEVAAKAVDGSGNEDSSPDTKTFTIDINPPETEVIEAPTGTIYHNDVSFEWVGSDDVTPEGFLQYSYMLEGYEAEWSEWVASTDETYRNLPSGSYTFKVKARDIAGNEDSTPAEQSFVIGEDTQPPETSITNGPEGVTHQNDVTFEWTGADDHTSTNDLLFAYKLEGYSNSWSGWRQETTLQYTDLPDGTYTFMVKAKDGMDNEDPTPAERTFTVVTTGGAPDTVILAGPEGAVNTTTVVFMWSGEDDVTPVEDLVYSYKLEGYDSVWSQWSSETSKSYSGLTEGSYTFLVKAKDGDGNEDPEPAERVFTVDVSAPTVALVKPESNSLYIMNKRILPFLGTIVIGSIDVEVDASDNTEVDHVDFYVDDVLKATDDAAPYVWTWSEKTFFRHTIKAVAYDAAGNYGI
ncbi:MAG TPA: hypothetical protein ENL13_04745, partial [Thermoplasmatales archaeon]|nr:hypothetical protein [Thermoplasmatales archaeon]